MLAGMIVSASYRTDIPAFYADWFQARLDAGVAEVRNPYGGAPYRVSLRPDEVTGYVFWSRNLAPFSAALERVAEQGVPFVLQFTVTGYPRALETSTIAVGTAVAQLRALAQRYGPRAIVWRYDPVLLTSLTPPDWHRAQVARLARELRGVTDEVCLSFAQIYRKTRRNLEQAAAQHDFAWHDPSEPEKAALLADLAAIAADYSISGTICSQATLGGTPARCIDIGRLSDIAGRALSARTKGSGASRLSRGAVQGRRDRHRPAIGATSVMRCRRWRGFLLAAAGQARFGGSRRNMPPRVSEMCLIWQKTAQSNEGSPWAAVRPDGAVSRRSGARWHPKCRRPDRCRRSGSPPECRWAR